MFFIFLSTRGWGHRKKESARATMRLLLFRLLSFLMGYPAGAFAEEGVEAWHLLTEKFCSRLLLKKWGIQDSLVFWIPHRGFRILCQWNLDSGLQLLVGFRIPWAVFRVPKPRIPDSTRQISRIPDSKYWISDFCKWDLDSRFQSLEGFQIP